MATEKLTNSNAAKKRGSASNAVLTTLFVVGAVVVINLIGTRVFGRVDLTEQKIYTLSQSSKDLVKNLPDFMNVKAFISEDLPPELKTVSRYVRDLVDEYKTGSKGKFRWSAIDPGMDKKLEEEATRCKVQKIQIQVLRQQKFEMGAYYLGLCLEYGSEVESIPQVARPEGLEYQMSSLIKRMTQKKKKLAFTTGHGESDNSQGFQALKEDLGAEFDVSTVNPSQAEIAKDIDALVVGGPKQAIDEKGQKEIDKFVMSGKGVIFLVDGMAMQAPQGGGMGDMQMKMGQANDTGLGKMLEAYGFRINQDFVFDRQAAPGLLDGGGGRKMLVNAPFFVVSEVAETKEHSVLAGIRGVVFPFASSVDLIGPLADGKKPADAKIWKLASSSKMSWKHTGFFVLQPNMKLEEGKDKSVSAFGYAYQGKLKSAFNTAPAVSAPDAPASETPKAVRVIVVGDSDFANDEYGQLARVFPVYTAGPQLLYNAIGWILEDEALTPLRSKTLNPRPITVADGTGTALQYANVLGLPLAFCLFGLARWRIRRATRYGTKL